MRMRPDRIELSNQETGEAVVFIFDEFTEKYDLSLWENWSSTSKRKRVGERRGLALEEVLEMIQSEFGEAKPAPSEG